MSLYITVDGQKILSYGKFGDIEINTWPTIDNKPARKNECYWNGSSVQLKTNQMLVDEYTETKLTEIKKLLYSDWPDSSKTITALKAQYDVVKNASSGWTSSSEVDTAYNDFVTFMDLS